MKRSASACVSLTVRFDAFSAGLEQEFERRINCAHAGKVVIAEIEAARGGHELNERSPTSDSCEFALAMSMPRRATYK